MLTILLLYNKEIKNSPLDIAVKKWAKQNKAHVVQYAQYHNGDVKTKIDIVIVRQSMINTERFEVSDDVFIMNSYQARLQAKDKFLLDKKLKELGIRGPFTTPYSISPKIVKSLPFPLILKPIVGAKGHGVFDINTPRELEAGEKTKQFGTTEILQKHFLLQEKVDGELYKVYGPYRGRWFFMNKNTGEEGFVPAQVARDCNDLLRSYSLYYAGIDFIVKDGKWYVIDLNATTGCKSLSKKNCQKLVDFLLRKFKRKVRTVVSAGAVIFKESGGKLKVAMVLDPKKDEKKKGCGWVFPRGHAEKGETLKAAALREIEEESGLKHVQLFGEIGVIKKVGRESDGERVFKVIHYFAAYAFDNKHPTPHPMDKHTETRWFDPATILDKCYYKNEAKLLRELL